MARNETPILGLAIGLGAILGLVWMTSSGKAAPVGPLGPVRVPTPPAGGPGVVLPAGASGGLIPVGVPGHEVMMSALQALQEGSTFEAADTAGAVRRYVALADMDTTRSPPTVHAREQGGGDFTIPVNAVTRILA